MDTNLLELFCQQITEKKCSLDHAPEHAPVKEHDVNYVIKEKETIAKIFGVKPATVQRWIRNKDVDAVGCPKSVSLTLKTFLFLEKKAHKMRNSEKLDQGAYNLLHEEYMQHNQEKARAEHFSNKCETTCYGCERKAETPHFCEACCYELCTSCQPEFDKLCKVCVATVEMCDEPLENEPEEEIFLECQGKDALIANLEREVEQERYRNFKLFQENCDIKTLIQQQQTFMMLHYYGLRQQGNKILQLDKPKTDKRSYAWHMNLEPQFEVVKQNSHWGSAYSSLQEFANAQG